MKYRESIVTSPLTSAAPTDAVLDTVRRADLRRRQRLALREGLAALTVALGILSAVAILRLAIPVSPVVWWLASALAIVPAAAAALRARWRQPDLLAAAAELDGTATLHDAVATATWFSTNPSSADSTWVEAQHARTASAAASLDVDALCPVSPPPLLMRAAGGLMFLLVVALLVPASWSRGVLGIQPDAPLDLPVSAASTDEANDAEGVDDTLMSPEELLAAAEQGLRTGAGTPELESDGTASAARGGASSDAGERGAEGDVPDVTGSGPPPADAERGDMDESARGDTATGESLQEALDRAIEEARQAAEAAEAESQADQPSGEEQSEDPSQNDDGGGAGGGEGGAGAPTEGDAAGAMPGGHLSGPGGDAADGLTLDAARAELEVTLKREQLASPFAALTQSDEALVERQSESGTSQLTFQNVAPMSGYQGTGAEAVRPVPWAYQELVRAYFLERARQDRKDPR